MLTYGGWSTLFVDGRWRRALLDAVAAVVGMIPEGLVLLTSLAFGVAAIQLAARKVLVQELAAVEVLARVDVLCLDKTGTLTTGELASTAPNSSGDAVGDDEVGGGARQRSAATTPATRPRASCRATSDPTASGCSAACRSARRPSTARS